ncbi:MAG TPA: hypothetical protein VGE08_18450 [Steroidobacter sp.]
MAATSAARKSRQRAILPDRPPPAFVDGQSALVRQGGKAGIEAEATDEDTV